MTSMETTVSFQAPEREKSLKSKSSPYEKEVILDSPDDIVKTATPELPRSRSQTPEIRSRPQSKQPSFTLPSLNENSKAPTPSPSSPSSRRSSVSEIEFLGALPSHDQLRRFSIASTKTDGSTYPDSSRSSPLQSGASSKVASPLHSSRKGSMSDAGPHHPVEYLSDPFTALSLGPSASAGQRRDSESMATGATTSDSEYTPSSMTEFGKSKSIYTMQPEADDDAMNGVKTKKRIKKKEDLKPSPLSESLSTEPALKDTTETSPKELKNQSTAPILHSPTTAQERQANLGFDGFQDDYLEDSEYKYKTAICRSHLATGYCEYGPACQYAHGVQELRPRDFDVKFKTELCKNYHAMGMCWFGSRCRFIHDEYRLQAGENEFWLVAPSENLVRVEVVDPENTARKKLLQSLVSLPPQFFPKPWEAQMREEGAPPPSPPHLPPQHLLPPHHPPHLPPPLGATPSQLPPHLQPHLQHQQPSPHLPPHLQPHLQPPIPPTHQFGGHPHYPLPFPVQPYPVHAPPSSTALPPFTSPLAATGSTPHYAVHSSPLTRSPPLSHTAPAFIPGVSSTMSSREVNMENSRTSMVKEKFAKQVPESSMASNPLWKLMENPAQRSHHAQVPNNFHPQNNILVDPREGSKYSLFTTTVREPPPKAERETSGERRKGSRKKKPQALKNAEIIEKDGDQITKKRDLALNILQSRATSSHPVLKVYEDSSPRTKPASPIMAPRTHLPTTPISQLTTSPTFPRLTHSSEGPTTPKPEVPQAPFSVFDTGAKPQTPGTPSFQPSASFQKSYTTMPSPTSAPRASPPASSSSSVRPWRRGGRVWGKRGTGRRETRSSPSSSSRTVSTTTVRS